MLHGDPFRHPVFRRLPKVPGHQRRAVGRPVGRHGQQQVSDGAPVIVDGGCGRGSVRVARPARPADGGGCRGARGQAQADARVGRTAQQHVRRSTGPVAHRPVRDDAVRHLQRSFSHGLHEFSIEIHLRLDSPIPVSVFRDRYHGTQHNPRGENASGVCATTCYNKINTIKQVYYIGYRRGQIFTFCELNKFMYIVRTLYWSKKKKL